MIQSKTSVIIPCHNYGRYLSWCIESVLNQTTLPLEIIVVNDSSTDNSEEVAHRYNDKIKYYQVSFKNAQKTRNFALEKAKGEFFYLLDADDYLDSKAIEILEDTLESNPLCKLAYSARYNFDDFNIIKKNGFGYVTNFQNFTVQELRKRNFIPMPSLIRRKYFKGFDERIHKHQDWEAWINFLKKDTDVVYIDLPLFYYRFHTTNMTSIQNNEYFERFKICIKHSLLSHDNNLSPPSSINKKRKKHIIILHSPEKVNPDYIISFIKQEKKNIAYFYLTGDKENYEKLDFLNMLEQHKIKFTESYDKSPDIILQKIRTELLIYKANSFIISNFSSSVIDYLNSINIDSHVSFSLDSNALLDLRSFTEVDTLVFDNYGMRSLLDIPDLKTQLINIFNKKLLLLLNRHVLWKLKYKNR